MQKMSFANLRTPLMLPNDAQCKKCGLFDTSRQDVLEILSTELDRDPKGAPTISEARCKCNDPVEARPRYSE